MDHVGHRGERSYCSVRGVDHHGEIVDGLVRHEPGVVARLMPMVRGEAPSDVVPNGDKSVEHDDGLAHELELAMALALELVAGLRLALRLSLCR